MALNIRHEAHFGRVVRCYADRAADADAMLRAAAASNPDGDAVVDGSVRLSHRALDQRATCIAAGLQAAGLQPGERVALLIGNEHRFVACLMGIIRAGLIAAPVSTRASARELAYILTDCGAAALIHTPDFAAILPAPGAAPALRRVIDADGPDYGRLEETPIESFDPPALAEEAPAVILYTSGTTGDPKGAMLTHLNLVHSAKHFEVCFEMSAADRSVMAVPATHVTGLVANIFAVLSVGGALLILPKFDVAGFLDLAGR